MKKAPFTPMALGLAAILLGCGEPDAPESQAPPLVPLAFEGVAEPPYVGEWTTSQGSTLSLGKDGKATMVNVSPGRGKTVSTGEWRVSGGKMLFKIEDSGGKVSGYDVKLSRDTLHMTQKATKLSIDYRRK